MDEFQVEDMYSVLNLNLSERSDRKDQVRSARGEPGLEANDTGPTILGDTFVQVS